MPNKSELSSAWFCSICIANYNGVDVIGDCLASIYDQGWGDKLEVIVHDDASSDDSVAFIELYYPQVKLIKSNRNVGFCTSNNRMVSLASGRYVLLLNNDAKLLPGALQAFADAVAQDPAPAILGLPQYQWDTGQLVDRGYFSDLFLNPIPNTAPRCQEVGMVSGACLWIPRSLWLELGGFPTWFESLAEDLYLCSQARLRGYPVKTLSGPGFLHRIGWSLGGGAVRADALVSSLRRRRLSERNKTFVMVLCFPWAWLAMILPLHLVTLLAEGAVLGLLKRRLDIFTDIYLACLLSLWRERRRLWQERQRIQAERKVGFSAFLRPVRYFPHKLTLLLRHGIPSLK